MGKLLECLVLERWTIKVDVEMQLMQGLSGEIVLYISHVYALVQACHPMCNITGLIVGKFVELTNKFARNTEY